MKRIFKNGHVVDPASKTDEVLDILVQDCKIAALDKDLSCFDAEIVDVRGLVVAPGFIDMHVHLREPGREDKETIESGTKAACRGGITAVCAMPNTNPPSDNISVIHYVLAKANEAGWAKVYPVGCISKGQLGEELAEMGKLAEAGACVFSDDGKSVVSSELMRRGLEYAMMLGKTIISHCEEPTLGAGGVMHEGYYSTMLGLRGVPATGEEIMVMRDLALAELTGGPIHIAHVSSKKSVELIRAAKKKGIKVTTEVTPHHLFLSHEMLVTYDTNLKMNPPLRTKEDKEALLAGLIDGTIDVVASDHAPHTREDKEVEFDLAPFGVSGVETTVQLLLSELVNKKLLSLKQLILAMSIRPSNILGIIGGSITKGAPANLTILDLKRPWKINKEEFVSKGKNTPFHGKHGTGMAVVTVVEGNILTSDGDIIAYDKIAAKGELAYPISCQVKSS